MKKLVRKLSARITLRVLLTLSALLTLLGLALMVWSMIEPTPLPVILAMSVGQVFGILAFAMFGGVVLADQLRKQRDKGAAARAAGATAIAAGLVAVVPPGAHPVAHAAPGPGREAPP